MRPREITTSRWTLASIHISAGGSTRSSCVGHCNAHRCDTLSSVFQKRRKNTDGREECWNAPPCYDRYFHRNWSSPPCCSGNQDQQGSNQGSQRDSPGFYIVRSSSLVFRRPIPITYASRSSEYSSTGRDESLKRDILEKKLILTNNMITSWGQLVFRSIYMLIFSRNRIPSMSKNVS